MFEQLRRSSLRTAVLCFLWGPPCLLSLLALAFCIWTVVGWVGGHTPAISAIFHAFPYPDQLVECELALPGIILVWAVLGSVLSWLIHALQPAGLSRRRFRQLASRLGIFLRRWGFLLILFLFLFSLARVWSAAPVKAAAADESYSGALLGYVPWGDAHGFHKGAFCLVESGNLDDWSHRRPLNQALLAMRLAMTGFHLRGAILLQCLLLAVASYLVVRIFGSCLGLWSAVGMLALLLAYGRLFQATTLSEALGLSIGALGFGLFYHGVRHTHFWSSTCGLFGLALSMSARAGAMFLLPCLLLWLGWQLRVGWKRWLASMLALVMAVALGLGWTFLLTATYGTGRGAASANFSYVCCGMALGGTWKDAGRSYAEQLSQLKNEKLKSDFLYAKSWELIRENPKPLFRALWAGERAFLKASMPFGSQLLQLKSAVLVLATMLLFSLALVVYLVRIRKRRERGFWLTCVLGFLLSMAVIFVNGGWRVLAASWPMIAAFFTLGLASPWSFSSVAPSTDRRAIIASGLILLVLACAALAGPWLIHNAADRLGDRRPRGPRDVFLTSRNAVLGGAIAVVGKGDASIAGVPNFNISQYRAGIWHPAAEDPKLLRHPPTPFLVVVVHDYVYRRSKHMFAPVDLLELESPYLSIKAQPVEGSRFLWRVIEFQASEGH